MANINTGRAISAHGEAIYALARLLKTLGVNMDQKNFAGAPEYQLMADQAMRRIEDLMEAASEAQKQWIELRAQLDAAQADISATAQDVEYERSRARMRLLELVFRAEMQPHGAADSWMLPRCCAVRDTDDGEDPAKVRAALMADLDALVALGLKGEVGP